MARPELDQLLSDALEAAIFHLERRQEFYPFGMTMHRLGETPQLLEYFAGEERPQAHEHLKGLISALRASAAKERLAAVAVIQDVTLTDRATGEKHDAISVLIEDRDGYAVNCYVPYTIVNRKVSAGKLAAEKGTPKIFSD